MTDIRKYKDSFGFIVAKSGSRLKSSFFTSLYYLSLYLDSVSMRKWYKKDFAKLLNKLKDDEFSGKFKSHPKQVGHQPFVSDNMSLPLLITLGAYNFKSELWAFFIFWLKGGVRKSEEPYFVGDRRGVAFKLPSRNTDFIGPFIRAFRAWYLWPVLFICDIQLLFNSLQIRTRKETNTDFTHLSKILQAKEVLPTPFSYFARVVYKKRLFSIAPSGASYIPKNSIQSALLNYCGQGNYENPPLDEAFRNIVELRL